MQSTEGFVDYSVFVGRLVDALDVCEQFNFTGQRWRCVGPVLFMSDSYSFLITGISGTGPFVQAVLAGWVPYRV